VYDRQVEFFVFAAPFGSAVVTPQDVAATWPGNATMRPDASHVRYRLRSAGSIGEVVGNAANGLLVSQRVAAELLRHDPANVTFVDATIETAASELVSGAHRVLRVRLSASFAELPTYDASQVAAVAEAPGEVIVSRSMREHLETAGLSAEHFSEPLFAAAGA